MQQQSGLQTFEITDPKTGMVIEMSGTKVPTEAEIRAAFAAVQKPPPSRMARVGDVVKGGIKGFASHGLQLLQNVAGTMPGFVNVPAPGVTDIPSLMPSLKPSNEDQQTGMTIESALEYLVPASRVSRGANTAANAVRNISVRAGRNRAAQAAVRAGVEGGAAATIASAQGDSPLTEAATSGALVTMAPGPRTAVNIGKSATRDVARALAPTTKKLKRDTVRIAPEVARRGVGGSLDDVEHLAEAQAARAGNQIGETYNAAEAGGTLINPRLFLEEIADAKRATYDTVPGPNGPKRVIKDDRGYAQYQAIEDLVNEYGDRLTIPQARGLIETWDEIVKRSPRDFQGRNIADATEAAVKQRARTSMRQLLNSNVPDVEQLNREYTFWERLRNVAAETNNRKSSQLPGGLPRHMSKLSGGITGGILGTAAGGVTTGGVGILIGGAAFESLNRVLTSPNYRLLSARVKQSLADALTSGNVTWMKREIGKAAAAINALSAGNSSVQK